MAPRDGITELEHRMQGALIGPDDVIRRMIVTVLANGHVPIIDHARLEVMGCIA